MAGLRILVLLLAAGAAITASAEDWPQFRGPGGQGHSAETGVPSEWSETRNVAWKTRVPGSGWSSPAIAGGQIWVTTAVDDAGTASLRAIAFDAATGREIVNTEVFRVGNARLTNAKNSHASPSPIVEAGRVYVHFGAEGSAALTTAGTVLWKTRLPYSSQHGNGGSPILYGDLFIVSCDGSDQAYVAALEKQTGKVRWKTSRRQPWDQAYSTPLIINAGGRDQLISAGAYRAASYEPETGREIWRVSYGDGFSNVPRPVYTHGLVLIATGFQQPAMLAVRPDGTGDVTRTHVAWKLERGAPFTPSPLAVGDELYMVSDIGIATCVNIATGEIHWQERLGGNYSASPVFADGRIYFSSEEGVTTVISPGKSFKRLAVNAVDGTTFASIAVSDRSIFLRSDTHLYRISEARQ